ncbi:rhomboid family intramembrane serine protease [Brevibacterium ravenspurgense]|uniref:rhomboid family intramembrane serine protease n=1 Tax=Brevibacterium ravenspurgense TaxID=479117 RepID=UPI0002D4189F|nr:rhomboid family intramembrane serine protease [Brevibacterium ravenspurgense]
MSSQQTPGVTLTVPAHYFAPVVMLALMWIMRVISTVAPSTVHALGVRAWSPSSLWAIATSPFVHVSWFHLLSNTIPFLILGLIVAFDGAKRFATVTVLSALAGGLGVFFVNRPGTVTVGASGLVFGYFGYLVLRGLFARGMLRKVIYIAVAVVVTGLYGVSMVIGLIPRGTSMSWQGHLFGLIGGCVAAWLVGSTGKQITPQNARPSNQTESQQTGDPELDRLLRDLDID